MSLNPFHRNENLCLSLKKKCNANSCWSITSTPVPFIVLKYRGQKGRSKGGSKGRSKGEVKRGVKGGRSSGNCQESVGAVTGLPGKGKIKNYVQTNHFVVKRVCPSPCARPLISKDTYSSVCVAGMCWPVLCCRTWERAARAYRVLWWERAALC